MDKAEKTHKKKIFRKQTNPEFQDFISKNIKEIGDVIYQLKEQINDKPYSELYDNKLHEMLDNLTQIKIKFDLFATKFKYYTEETERSHRKLGYLLKEYSNDINFLKSAYNKENNEIYLLNLVNNWTILNSNIRELYYNIENNNYPYTIHTVFTLAFVLVPFLNIFSLVGGIYLVTHKDWRALIFGAIALGIYFLQLVNVFYLAILPS